MIQRVNNAGYLWSWIAENILNGESSVDRTMQGWLNSPGHCLNIMNANAKDVGSANKGKYWTQVFASD